MRYKTCLRIETFLVLLGLATTAGGFAAAEPTADSVARAVIERLGGRDAWEGTRYAQWRFFGRRHHSWDRHTGDIRIHSPAHTGRDGTEVPERLTLMNVHTKEGRVWEGGVEVTDDEKRRERLDEGHSIWINDSYWMFMPFKLEDPGVNLRYAGTGALPEGGEADVLELTFDAGIGDTPENKYEVFVSRASGLIEQWAFYSDAGDAEPRFTLPWADWERFGDLWLATRHQELDRAVDWEIALPESLDPAVFRDPDRAVP